MKYKIELNKKAQKFIKSQPRNQQERILKAVSKLPDGDVKALSGNSNAYYLYIRFCNIPNRYVKYLLIRH